MLRSSTQSAKSHGDDLGLQYLWNRDEYSSLENSFKAIEKMPNMKRTRSLSPRRDQSLFTMRLRQRHCIWRSFSDCPGIDILYDPEERDDKGELIKLGITCYLGEQHR